MEKNPFARGFGDLIVYQKARSIARDVYELSRSFPREETYSLTVAADCGYLACETADAIAVRLHEVGRMLQSMIARADDFQGTDHARVREETSSYGSIDDFFSEH